MRLTAALSFVLCACSPHLAPAAPAKPNILYILCDDLGYGDLKCLNPERGKIATPSFDRLAAQGMAFTDAHSGSAVCTPTRYGILTGRYAWRTKLQRGVLGGFSPPLIDAGRLTVPAFLQQHGYHTICVGKWHLGMNFTSKPGDGKEERYDWSKPIAEGPVSRGFDEYFGISASLDMPPYVFIRNDRLTAEPTVEKQWIRRGPAAADFEAVDVLPALAAEAVRQIKSRAAAAKDGKPFFLYLPLTSPHTPIEPTAEWRGKSGLGQYGDFVMQTDAAIGEVLKALDEQGLANDTLVIATSDNGCSPAAGTEKLEQQGHFASGESRGYKADIWDGGHRVPFLARWPGVVKPGSRCDRIVCLTDLMATCSDVLGAKLPDAAGEDSFSILPLLKGEAKAERESVVHHSISGMFALREQKWKLVLGEGSGGWSKGSDGQDTQLYDMDSDPGETKNMSNERQAEVTRLTKAMQEIIERGRSRPGPKVANDVDVVLRKAVGKKAKQSRNNR